MFSDLSNLLNYTDILSDIPLEIAEIILEKLKPMDVGSLAFTSKYWYETLTSGIITTGTVFVNPSVLKTPIGRCFRSGKFSIDQAQNLQEHLKNMILKVDGYATNLPIKIPTNLTGLRIILSGSIYD